MRCAFTPLAAADLEEIGDYIAKDNPVRALSFIRELRDRCEKIVHMPRAAPLRPELGEGVRIGMFGRSRDLLFGARWADRDRTDRSRSQKTPSLVLKRAD